MIQDLHVQGRVVTLATPLEDLKALNKGREAVTPSSWAGGETEAAPGKATQ